MKMINIFKKSVEIIIRQKTRTSVITTQLLLFFMIAFLAISPFKTYAQPNLGTAVNYVLFTSSGNVVNVGTSVINGNIGTNSSTGIVSGYGSPSTHNGNIEIATAATSQCAADVQQAYTEISTTAATISHVAIFGNGETVVEGVYGIPGAGSVTGNLTLDGGGNSNSIFIFKFGGAFSTTANSTIILTNGAQVSNVFWVSAGAISMAASTTMKGTLISSPGAVSMAAGGNLEGRMLSTAGAINTDNINATGGGIAVSDTDNDGVSDTDDNCPNTTTAQASSAGFISDCTASPSSCGCTDADGDAFFPDAVSSAATYDPDDTDACIPNANATNCNSVGCNVAAPTLSGN